MYKGLNHNNGEEIGYITGKTRMDALNRLKDSTDVKTVYYFESRLNIPILNKIRSSMLESMQRKRIEARQEPKSRSLITRIKDAFAGEPKLKTKKKKMPDNRPFTQKVKDFLLSDVGGSGVGPERSVDIDWDMIDGDEKEKAKGLPKFRVRNEEIIIFTKRLNMMLSSGISLSRSLDILSDNPNKDLVQIIENVIEDITEGISFSDALAKYPDQFNVTYIAMISIGEDSGNIPDILDEIVEYMERNQDITSKLKTASIYPGIIGVVLATTMILGSIFFIPEFKKMFGGAGAALPFFTRVVFKISDWLPFIFLGFAVFIIIIQLLRRFILSFDRLVREFIDRFKIRAVVIKDIFMAAYMYNVSSSIYIMISSGIRLKDTIDLTRRTVDNIFIQGDLANVSDMMIEGHSFSEALAEQPHMDQLLTSIVLTGEESGDLERALHEISDYYNYELNTRVNNAMETIQPVLMIVVGLIAIPVIIAIYLPIFDISTGQFI